MTGRPVVVGLVALAVAFALSALDPMPAAADEADRRDARRILERDEYQPSAPPRPFRGVLQWIGDRLAPIGRFLARVFDDWTTAVAALAVVAAVSVAAAAAMVRRRDRAAGARRRAMAAVDERLDPDALEREADGCERAGELEAALRRRFLAGLLRLDRAGTLAYRSDATSGSVRRALGSPSFDGLARTFDEVVYGRRGAAPADLDEARSAWPRVLQESSR